MLSEWNEEKRKIISALTAPSGAPIEMPRRRKIYTAPPRIDIAMGVEEAVYAAKVHEYNATSGRTIQKINLIELFGNAAKEFHDTVGFFMERVCFYSCNFSVFFRKCLICGSC